MLGRHRSTNHIVTHVDARPTRRSVVDRVAVGCVVEVVGLAAIVIGSFGPWLRSGERLRTSYELFQVADRLGFLGGGAVRWLPRVWVCVPFAAALALTCHVRGRHAAGASIAAVVAAAALVVAGAVIASPLSTVWGSVLGVAAAVTTLLGVVLSFTSPSTISSSQE